MTDRLAFALLHATLGWSIAALVCLALRRATPGLRCWAWRVALLKGPLALAAALPIALSVSPPVLVETLAHSSPSETSVMGQLPLPNTVVAEPPSPVDPLPFLYGGGFLATFALRVAASRWPQKQEMPRVVGVLRPQVVLPNNIPEDKAILAQAHEEAHVRRRDPLWSLVADLCCVVLWFSPCTWLAARGMRAEAEAACDLAAVRATGASRHSYARLLLDFAGPAPANALGGPARRLARRIAMLQITTKSPSRALLTTLSLLATATLLPWTATAAPQTPDDGPLSGEGRNHPASSLRLSDAAKLMLTEPGMRSKVGWTADQEAGIEKANQRWRKIWEPFAAELYRRQKTMTLREFSKWDSAERPRALARANAAAEPFPWTIGQERRLKSLALARYGSAVWADPELATRLHLTSRQLSAIAEEDRRIVKRYFADSKLAPITVRPQKPMPAPVKKEIELLTQRYLDASPADRTPLNDRIWALKSKYAPIYSGYVDIEKRRPRERTALENSWKMRADADRRLLAKLDRRQVAELEKLKSDPSAWDLGSVSTIGMNGQMRIVRKPAHGGNRLYDYEIELTGKR